MVLEGRPRDWENEDARVQGVYVCTVSDTCGNHSRVLLVRHKYDTCLFYVQN